MKRYAVVGLGAAVLLGGVLSVQAQTNFTVTLDRVYNGKIKVEPAIPADGKVAAGTVLTVTATPDDGHVLDSVYYAVQEMWFMYHESMRSPYQFVVNADMNVGASFIDEKQLAGMHVIQDIVYAKPGVKPLKYDVFAPKGAKNLPCIVIIHGGGWIANTEDIMRGMARELAHGGKYVVFSIDYRWAGMRDSDETANTMVDVIEDVFGAIALIMEHAEEYGADPNRIAVTGDSAGGHLAAVAGTMSDKIGEGGFGKTPGVFEFTPSYVPEGKSVEQVRAEITTAIRVAAPSYGVFNGDLLNHFSTSFSFPISDHPNADPSWIDAVAPLKHIPDASEREIPHYLIRGSLDSMTDKEMRQYMDALVHAGQRVEYVQVGGAGHAFFDWKPDPQTKAIFNKYGVYSIHEMEAFFNSVFYPEGIPYSEISEIN